MTKHKVLRVHGGRLVVAERRVELEGELDTLAAQGFTLVNSFAVDDNVYLVLAGADCRGERRPWDGDPATRSTRRSRRPGRDLRTWHGRGPGPPAR